MTNKSKILKEPPTKTMCPIPWSGLQMRNNGTLRVCCNSNSYTKNRGVLKDKNGKALSIKDYDVEEHKNNPLMKEVRASMIKGEWHPECMRCKKEEEVGQNSRRVMLVRDIQLGEVELDTEYLETCLENTQPDGTINVDDFPSWDYDIRYGNFCNLKCVMCGPTDSHMWIKDNVKLKKYSYPENGGADRVNIGLDQKNKVAIDMDYNWFDGNELFDQYLYDNAEHIRLLYIAGGEPLLIPKHFETIQWLVDNNHAHHIKLNYNTNLTKITDETLDLWSNFAAITIGASIDGYGTVNEYQRFPSNWNKLYENMKKVNEWLYSKEKRYNAMCSATITSVNVFHYPDFIRFMLEEGNLNAFGSRKSPFGIKMHMCHTPPPMNIKCLPEAIKQQVRKEYSFWLDYFKTKNYNRIDPGKNELFSSEYVINIIEKQLSSILRFMDDVPKSGRVGPNDSNISNQWETFLFQQILLDEERGTDLGEVVPEYKSYIIDYKRSDSFKKKMDMHNRAAGIQRLL